MARLEKAKCRFMQILTKISAKLKGAARAALLKFIYYSSSLYVR